MGYHFTITRERHNQSSPIPLEDWLAFVRASPDLEFDTPAGDDPVSRFTRSIHAARWSGAEGAWLGWSDGAIWTKNPSEELIRYMIEIAPGFQARVRGDEGEFFRTLDEVYFEEEGREVSWEEHEQQRTKAATRQRNSRWSRADTIRGLILLFVLALILWKYFS